MCPHKPVMVIVTTLSETCWIFRWIVLLIYCRITVVLVFISINLSMKRRTSILSSASFIMTGALGACLAAVSAVTLLKSQCVFNSNISSKWIHILLIFHTAWKIVVKLQFLGLHSCCINSVDSKAVLISQLIGTYDWASLIFIQYLFL